MNHSCFNAFIRKLTYIIYNMRDLQSNIRKRINYADVIARDQELPSIRTACIPAPHVILRARIPMIRQAALIRLYGARAQVTFTFSVNHNIDRSLSIGAAY